MKDHYNNAVDPRDLTTRLNRIQKSHSSSNDGDSISRLPRFSRAGTSSSETSSTMSRLPTFHICKSATMSITASDETHVSRFEISRGVPVVRECTQTIEVGRGGFSKPSLRRRRESSESAKSTPEFQYYGRHANTWLFNDFSVTESVRKGWGRIVGKGQE
ncbi:hypothetical protein BU23DRAFT_554492 [Bimuria novae-zelandiae CBS 107.79]|uniref:Uncharacterized protein n=1 Tax=Bimuria novae-zelandiae CBS 107.79 TaxID=1447943 RepID=A0A6A5V8N6_9PLEO|nr:hypothetical protein BU23DRAFT_554492 [Bimuria novae-zelandiae CBS 107.79]